MARVLLRYIEPVSGGVRRELPGMRQGPVDVFRCKREDPPRDFAGVVDVASTRRRVADQIGSDRESQKRRDARKEIRSSIKGSR